MSELDRILKTLSFPQQFIEVGKNILYSLNAIEYQHLHSSETEHPHNFTETIDGKEFITELTHLYNRLPKDQLASAVFLENTPLTAHGPFGLLILTASTLEEAFQCLLDYLEQIIPVFEISKVESTHHTYFTFKLLYDFGEINHFLTEIITLSPLKVHSFLDQRLQPLTVHFSHPPCNPLSLYETAFDAIFKFNRAQNTLIISKKDLKIPLNTANPTTHAWIKSQLNQQIKILSNRHIITNQVKRFILQNLKNNISINLNNVSEALFMSERTLSRRLKEEGKTLSELKLEVGIEYAKLLLLDSNKSINDIAIHAGFTNTASFGRAFKRFTMQTPSQFKKNLNHHS